MAHPAAPRPPAPSRPRRRHRALRILGITLVALLVLLLAVDRGADYIAEQTAASKLQDSQNLPHEPDVDIAGFPFLNQALSRHFDQISVEAKDVPLGGGSGSLTLSTLDVTLDDLTVSSDFDSVHADNAHAVGVIGYAALSDALGVQLSYAGDGRVKASKEITILGRTFTPTVTAAPVLVDGALSFGKAQINGLGSLAGQLSSVLEQVFSVKPPLGGIPFDITVQKLSVNGSGLRIDLVGADLDYRDGS